MNNFLKKLALFFISLLFLICVSIRTIIHTEAVDLIKQPPIVRTEKQELVSFSQIPNVSTLDFGTDIQSALKWSEKYSSKILPPFQDMNKTTEIINKHLREKYRNRDDLFPRYDALDVMDTFVQDTTITNSDMILYGYYTEADFGLHTNTLTDTYNTVLKDTEYGIDYGYFVGELAQRDLGERLNGDKEKIIIKLKIPKGTPMYHMGNGKHILPRKFNFIYTSNTYIQDPLQNYLILEAELIDESIFKEKSNEIEKYLFNKLQDFFEEIFGSDLVTLELNPTGLNAGFLFTSIGEKVLNLVFESQALATIFTDYTDLYPVINFSTGGYVTTKLYSRELDALLSEEDKKANFETMFAQTEFAAGLTSHDSKNDWVGIDTRLGYTRFPNDIIKNNKIIENYAATMIHELFHYAQFNTKNFENRQMFEQNKDFITTAEELKNQEQEHLTELLNDPYCKVNYLEFLSEAFKAKYHPINEIKDQVTEKIPKTNRFLDNLYDLDPPSSPANLHEISVQGNSATIKFDHSSDNVGVDKYVIYMKKYGDETNFQSVKTVLTKKDSNGLSLSNPSDEELDVMVTVDQLEQHTYYEFYVKAFDEALNESNRSNIIRIKTKDTEPPELEGVLNASTLVSNAAFISLPKATDNVGVEELKLTRIEESFLGIDRLFSPTEKKIISLPANTKQYTDITIKKGIRYTYTMTALDASGNESIPSNQVTIQTTDDDDRKQNEDKVSNKTSSSATLNWGGVFSNPAKGFKIFGWVLSPLGWIDFSEQKVDGTSDCHDVSLAPGKDHIFLVVPIDDNDDPLEDGLKINVDAPPIQINNLQATIVKRTLIALQWDAPQIKSDLSYDVYRNNQLVDTVSATEYIDVDLDPGTNYTYQVIPKLEDAVKSTILSVDTLDPYEESIIRFSSTSSPYEGRVITFVSNTKENIELQTFNNKDTQFIKLSYNEEKKAYQLKNKETNQVLGITADEAKQVIASENKYDDHQYWKLKDDLDDLDDFVRLENLDHRNFVLDVFPEPRTTNPILCIKPKEVARELQQFIVLQDTEPPTTPGNLRGIAITDKSAKLSWEASEDNVGVVRYDIYQQSKLVASVDSKTHSYQVENLNSLTMYQYTVKAVDGSENESEASNIVEIHTLPKAPKKLKTSGITESAVMLQWETDETSSLVTGYDIYQDGEFIQTVPKNKMSYQVNNLVPDREYTFTVRTKTETILSEHSNKETIRTLSKNPEITATDITTNSVKINWEPEKISAVYYEIYQNNRLIATTGSKTSSYTATNLLPATAYIFSVITRWDNVRTAPLNSNEVSVVTNPIAPVNLHAEDITETSVNISWEDEGNGNELIGYEVYRDNTIIHTTDKQTLNYIVENLDPTTSYDFTIRAKIKNGGCSESSNVLTLKIEDHWDKVQIPISLSQLKEGDRGRGYSFIDNRLLFNESASNHRYILSSQHISNASIHIKSNITTQLTLDNLQIHTDQPITIEDDASVTIVLKENSQNTLTATKGAVISTGKKTNLIIDAEGENDQVGRLDVVAPPNMHAIGGETSYVELNAKNGIRSVTYNVHPIKSSNSYNQGGSHMVAIYLNNKKEYDNQNRTIDLYEPSLSMTTKIDTLTAYQISRNNIVYMFTCPTDNRYQRTKINDNWVFYKNTLDPGGNINIEIRPYKEFVYYESATQY